jgi:hypothetical protein
VQRRATNRQQNEFFYEDLHSYSACFAQRAPNNAPHPDRAEQLVSTTNLPTFSYRPFWKFEKRAGGAAALPTYSNQNFHISILPKKETALEPKLKFNTAYPKRDLKLATNMLKC